MQLLVNGINYTVNDMHLSLATVHNKLGKLICELASVQLTLGAATLQGFY